MTIGEPIPLLAVDPFADAFLADPYRHHAALRDLAIECGPADCATARAVLP